MKYGENFTKQSHVIVNSGQRLPNEWTDRPKIHENILWIWEGFHELYTERPLGLNGAGFIPITKIYEYCKLLGYENDLRNEFVYCIRAMDKHQMEYMAEVNKPKDK